MAHAEGTFLWWRLSIPSSRTIAYIVDKQSGICMCFVVVVFFFKFKWKVLKQINPNLSGLSRGLLLLQQENEFENHAFIWICILILLLVYTTSLTSLCFNKKFEQEKKSLFKSISKSIHVDTANIYLFKANDVVLVFLLLALNIFHTFF